MFFRQMDQPFVLLVAEMVERHISLHQRERPSDKGAMGAGYSSAYGDLGPSCLMAFERLEARSLPNLECWGTVLS